MIKAVCGFMEWDNSGSRKSWKDKVKNESKWDKVNLGRVQFRMSCWADRAHDQHPNITQFCHQMSRSSFHSLHFISLWPGKKQKRSHHSSNKISYLKYSKANYMHIPAVAVRNFCTFTFNSFVRRKTCAFLVKFLQREKGSLFSYF